MDPDDQAPNVASQQFSSMSSGATVTSYSCLLPAPFDGNTDVEDFASQFNSVASLSVWEDDPSDNFCLQFFSARLSGDAMSFYLSLTRTQQTNMNRLLHAFRTQYAPYQGVLTAKAGTLRQQARQTIPDFFRKVGDLARNAYLVEAVRKEILLTTFFASLYNPTVRREVRKAKPPDADAALQAAAETHSFLEIDYSKIQTSGVNNFSTETLLDTFTEVIRSLCTKVEDVMARSSRTQKNFPKQSKRSLGQSR